MSFKPEPVTFLDGDVTTSVSGLHFQDVLCVTAWIIVVAIIGSPFRSKKCNIFHHSTLTLLHLESWIIPTWSILKLILYGSTDGVCVCVCQSCNFGYTLLILVDYTWKKYRKLNMLPSRKLKRRKDNHFGFQPKGCFTSKKPWCNERKQGGTTVQYVPSLGYWKLTPPQTALLKSTA